MLLCARLCKYSGTAQIPFAAVVEFIHTATLLHDDVVDNADLRRGNASANTVWGTGASILVGDYLLAKAFSLAVKNGSERILNVLAHSTTRMAEGEVFQLVKHADIELTEDEYMDVVSSKTAVLFSVSAQVPAILGDAPLEEEVALANYGMAIGTAYQLTDDCLDYVSNDKDLGKTIGNDLKEGKVTLPLIKTYKEASEKEKAFLKESVETREIAETRLDDVMELINKYDGIGYTRARAMEYVEDAKANLDLFEPLVERMALQAVADFVIDRSS